MVTIRRRVIEVILQQEVNQYNIIRPSVLSGEEYTKQNCLKFWNFLNLPPKMKLYTSLYTMQCSAFLAPVRCPEEVFHQARRTALYPSVQSVLCED